MPTIRLERDDNDINMVHVYYTVEEKTYFGKEEQFICACSISIGSVAYIFGNLVKDDVLQLDKIDVEVTTEVWKD